MPKGQQAKPGLPPPAPQRKPLWDRANLFGDTGGARTRREARTEEAFRPSRGALGRNLLATGRLQPDRSVPLPELKYAQTQGRDDRTDPPEIGDRADSRPAKGIQDNSFLLEEGYNQEPGVVQNINVLRRQRRDWLYAFIQEFPIGSQAHQFSYTLPFADLRNGQRAAGLGDLLLNYRPQVLYESDATPSIAPRFSLILPTGSKRRGLGNGSFGFQSNVAVSKVVSDRVTLHANTGVTTLFNVQGRTPFSLNLGGSAIYAATRDFNLLFETVAEQFELVSEERRIDRGRAVTLSPGLRYAFNFTDAQLTLGLAAPVTVSNREKPSYGVLFYLSFESKLF